MAPRMCSRPARFMCFASFVLFAICARHGAASIAYAEEDFPSTRSDWNDSDHDALYGGRIGQEEYHKQPIPFTERPLTLPASTLRIEPSLVASKFGGGGSMADIFVDPHFVFALGSTFGVLDDLEFGAVFLPLTVSPEFQYGSPNLHATLRFLHGALEMGLSAAVDIAAHSDLDTALTLAVPVLFHLGKSARLDTGFTFTPVFADPVTHSEGIPVNWAFAASPETTLFLMTGIFLSEFDFDALSIPLGFGLAYAVPSPRGPIVDVSPYVLWPTFLVPNSDEDKVVSEAWVAGIQFRIYLYL